ncbi:plasmid pRiA4b ORF-3 family protein [Kitasatospora sp. NPDC088346]|uniref:plasmid pRiA4b ORF-3 family protein n=1 Tax=Kitasatospora sp. NPDC088346 TaxID=3364073 RepID=UPI0037F91456
MANTTGATPGPDVDAARTVHTITVTLTGSEPPIWRRLEVPSSSTLRELHEVLQAAVGWEDHHLWVFDTPLGRFGAADRELGIRDAAGTRLGRVAQRPGDRIRYTYDFGADWHHDVAVEAVGEAEPGVAYPRCVDGARACPPEDCGGIEAYRYLVEVLADPAHDEHDEQLEWLGLDAAQDFDPAAFEPAAADRALAGRARVLTGN